LASARFTIGKNFAPWRFQETTKDAIVSTCSPSRFFLEEKNQVEGTRRKCAPDAVDLLKLHPWPGTGLRTYLHRVFIMAGEVGLQGPAPETETMQITQSTTTIQAHNNTPSSPFRSALPCRSRRAS
jgi:hypothetical protein